MGSCLVWRRVLKTTATACPDGRLDVPDPFFPPIGKGWGNGDTRDFSPLALDFPIYIYTHTDIHNSREHLNWNLTTESILLLFRLSICTQYDLGSRRRRRKSVWTRFFFTSPSPPKWNSLSGVHTHTRRRNPTEKKHNNSKEKKKRKKSAESRQIYTRDLPHWCGET